MDLSPVETAGLRLLVRLSVERLRVATHILGRSGTTEPLVFSVLAVPVVLDGVCIVLSDDIAEVSLYG